MQNGTQVSAPLCFQNIELIFFQELHPYKAPPPLFLKKSLSKFVNETKDQTLTQAIHTIQKEVVHSDMSAGVNCDFFDYWK